KYPVTEHETELHPAIVLFTELKFVDDVPGRGSKGLAVHVVDQRGQEHQPDHAPAPAGNRRRSRLLRNQVGVRVRAHDLSWSECLVVRAIALSVSAGRTLLLIRYL